MNNFKLAKKACYLTGVTMAITANLSPILFLTFRSMYNLSYTLLGFLVVINFFTQLFIDLMLSFFMDKFNIVKSVQMTPFLCFFGLLIFGLWPLLFPDCAYIGLVIGTLIFSASGGFSEVLISPVIASIPSDEPDREMSKLHSIYAWGVVGVVIFATIFLTIFGEENWYILTLLLMAIPVFASILFSKAEIPEMETPE